jgi:carbon monoxide dehydrogenase subunit G
MELSHSFTVPASVEQTWATFMDIEGVAECFPGAVVTEATEDAFTGTVKVKLGPIALTYAGNGSFVERDEAARRAVIEAKGKDKRGNGTASATVTIALADESGASTRADVATDLSITGKPAQFGRGVIQDVSDKLLGQFIACIEDRLSEAGAPAEAAATAPAPSAGAAPEPAGPEPVGAGPAEAPAPERETPVPPTVQPAARPATARAGAATPPPRPRKEAEPLDLGSAVMPVLLRRYGAYVAAGVVGLVVGFLIGWRVGG